MSVLPRFTTALAGLTGPDFSGSESLPVRMAIGAAAALHVDAAGISVMDVLRVPLGASSADADVLDRMMIRMFYCHCILAFMTFD
ncbi:MAG: hypothetical protein QOI69_2992, partial [Pseudonocardiales bacterium]|nr:hypothetical protein [Pseudonocardiales bacterium]